jgi:hypothetical protein
MSTRKIATLATTLVAFAWGLFVPMIAEACPVCAQGETGGIGRKIALGLFIFLPFAVVGTILFVLRSAAKREQQMFVQRSEA